MSYVVEEEFDYKGIHGVVVFRSSGYRCGYAGFTEDAPIADDDDIFHGKGQETIEEMFSGSCHCGVTYISRSNEGYPVLMDKPVLWIGFDCGHACDGIDFQKADELFGPSPARNQDFVPDFMKNLPCRDVMYVKENIKSLIDMAYERKQELEMEEEEEVWR